MTKASQLIYIKTEKDLVCLLKADTFPGLDKLQWNMLRKRLKRFLNKAIKDNNEDINEKLFKKVKQKILKMINIS
jgi:mannitol-1-phosphate/altronate dehydrogenase